MRNVLFSRWSIHGTNVTVLPPKSDETSPNLWIIPVIRAIGLPHDIIKAVAQQSLRHCFMEEERYADPVCRPQIEPEQGRLRH